MPPQVMDEAGPDSEYVPFGHRRVVEAPRALIPKSSTTRSSLLIAVLPLVALIVDIFIFSVSGEVTTWVNVAIVAGTSLLVSFGLAKADQRRLRELGHVVSTSPLIALICPVAYLFIRGSRAWRETATGLTAAWLNVLVVAIVGLVLYELPVVIAVLNGLSSATL